MQLLEESYLLSLAFAARLAAGRLALARESTALRQYNPIGYALAFDKDVADERSRRQAAAGAARRHRLLTEAERRLEAPSAGGDVPFTDYKIINPSEQLEIN